jgi:predicted negative regulator of RcsB-dependent stress response
VGISMTRHPYNPEELDGISRILVAEFDALRREIEILIEHQKEIMNFSILILTAMAGLFGIIETKTGLDSLSYVFLLFPWIFFLLMLLYADKIVRILRVADYLHNYLRKRIIEICGENFWEWELYKSHESSFKIDLALTLDRIRWIIFIVPIILSLVIFYVLSLGQDHFRIALLVMDIIAIVIGLAIVAKWVIIPLEETEPIKDRPVVDLKVSAKREAAKDVAKIVIDHFAELPENILRESLLALSEDDKIVEILVGIINSNFSKLDKSRLNRLLLNLSIKDKTAEIVASIMESHFSDLRDVRNRLLLSLSKKDKTAKTVASIMQSHFGKLSKDIRNRLLLNLSRKDEAAKTVASIMQSHFSDLPRNVRNRVLLNLSRKDKTKIKLL